jgi:DNA-binding transcriptional ArsR family regulator
MHRVVNLGKCLADPILVRMMLVLLESEQDINGLQTVLDLKRGQIDQRLSKLRTLGIVEGHREGRWLKFSIDIQYTSMLRYLTSDFDPDVEWNERVRADAERLKEQMLPLVKQVS